LWLELAGSIIAQSACRNNVAIGGGRSSSVPANFTAFVKIGDGQTFESGVLSYKYDAAITTAVNDYLYHAPEFSGLLAMGAP
jgi:hypothetical protein